MASKEIDLAELAKKDIAKFKEADWQTVLNFNEADKD